MVSNVFGYDDKGDYGRQWLARNFLVVAVESRKDLNLSLSRGQTTQLQRALGFTEEELDSYRYTHPYMYQRGLTDEIIEKFDIGFDMATNCITFPCYYEHGEPAFIARRSVVSKFFNYPEDVIKPVYGANLLTTGEYPEVIICESFFNALTCWKYGKAAVALIGTGAEHQYNVLRSLPVRKYIIGTDPDEAGRKAANKLKFELGRSKLLTFLDLPEGQDINDLDSKFLSILEYF
jgi:DNA primase